jgi:hypothetical protein
MTHCFNYWQQCSQPSRKSDVMKRHLCSSFSLCIKWLRRRRHCLLLPCLHFIKILSHSGLRSKSSFPLSRSLTPWPWICATHREPRMNKRTTPTLISGCVRTLSLTRISERKNFSRDSLSQFISAATHAFCLNRKSGRPNNCAARSKLKHANIDTRPCVLQFALFARLASRTSTNKSHPSGLIKFFLALVMLAVSGFSADG